jgi:hypothetical protein
MPETELAALNTRAEPGPMAMHEEPQTSPDDDLPLRVGAKVRHARWGEGMVVGVEKEGSDVLVTVRFASVGRKRLSLQYAHLEEL